MSCGDSKTLVSSSLLNVAVTKGAFWARQKDHAPLGVPHDVPGGVPEEVCPCLCSLEFFETSEEHLATPPRQCLFVWWEFTLVDNCCETEISSKKSRVAMVWSDLLINSTRKANSSMKL